MDLGPVHLWTWGGCTCGPGAGALMDLGPVHLWTWGGCTCGTGAGAQLGSGGPGVTFQQAFSDDLCRVDCAFNRSHL